MARTSKSLGDGDGFLGDGRGEDSGDDDVFVGFENVRGVGFMVHGADGVGEFRGREIGGFAQIIGGRWWGLLLRASRCRFLCRARRGVWAGWGRGLGGGGDVGVDGVQLRACAGVADAGFTVWASAVKSEEALGATRHAAAAKKTQEIPVTMRTDERRKRFLRENLADCDSSGGVVRVASYVGSNTGGNASCE